MLPAKDGSKRELNKKHLGIAGLITVLMQFGVGAKYESATQRAFQQVVQEQLKTQKAELRTEQERGFVRKADLDRTLQRLDRKIDQIDEKLDQQNTKISKIEGYLKARRTWGQSEPAERREFTSR